MMHDSNLSTRSGDHEDRLFWVFVLLVVLIFLFLGIGVTFAQTVTVTEHITVGSRAVGAEAEKAVPVDVITQQQIAASGYAETAQVIQSLAPSFNFPRPTLRDGTDTVRPATLRGLGPDQVLVLINGKRRHQSALVHLNGTIGRGSTGVDLNATPVSAIDRIEVLRDGAAAQYGSDAITIDAYRIAIDDRIVLSGNFTAPQIAVLLAPFGANSARFFTNAIDTRTKGIDATVTYRLELNAAGDASLRAGYNNTRTRVVGEVATPPQLAGFESVLFDRIERRRLECGQPKDSVRLGGDWRLNKVGVNVNVARYGDT